MIFGESIQLIVAKSGLYGIPISPYNTVLNNVTTGLNKSVTLLPTNKNKSKYDIALKLHRKFAHPSPGKLIKLINSAGEHWERMRNLKKSLKNVSVDCKICQIYRKSPARPVVGSAMATSFKECVAMGLKFYKGKIIPHLVDHTTRLSTSCFVTSKEPKAIIN